MPSTYTNYVSRFDRDRIEYERHCRTLLSSIDAQTKDDLLLALLMKRHVDGLNGRSWDSTTHLRWEDEISTIIARLEGERGDAHSPGRQCRTIVADLADLLRHLADELRSMEAWTLIAVVPPSAVTGKRQENGRFGHEYVDQSGGGVTGDSFSGHLYLPIDGCYLKIAYCS